MLPLLVGLGYLAEVSLSGVWRWAVFAAVVACLAFAARRPSDARHGGSFLGAAALGAAAWSSGSALLGILAALLVAARWRPRPIEDFVALSLAAMGVHLLYWRYLSVFDLERLPVLVATALSWLFGGLAHVTPTSLIVRGQSISFSGVPWVTIGVVTGSAAVISSRSPRGILRALIAWLLAIGIYLMTLTTLAVTMHAHYFSAPSWPLVAVGVGFGMTLLVVRGPGSHPVAVPWGLWCSVGVGLAVLLVIGVGDPVKKLRIAFDEAHGRWETVQADFNATVYGRGTVYNYALLRRWLAGKHDVFTLDTPFTDIDADVLVVKTPTTFFGDEEKRAVDAFVQRGGLLLVIGDHTNLYGTAFVINDLVQRYGLKINADATVPWDGPHYDFQAAWWQRNRLLRGVSTIQFETAASVTGRHPLVLPILIGDRVAAEAADYSNERFFGELHPGPEDRQPPVIMGASRHYGRGRILLFADSTIFSNFSLMSPGNAELFQNLIEQGSRDTRIWSWLLAALLLTVAAAFAKNHRVVFLLSVITLVTALETRSWVPDAPMELYPGRWVEIDGRHSHLELRADPRGTHGEGLDDFSTFYAWIGRLGFLPRVTREPYQASTRPTIIINPDRPFDLAEQDAIEHYVKQGGRLLILDDPRHSSRSTAPALLSRFGVEIRSTLGSGAVHDAGGRELSTNLLAVPFELLQFERRIPAAVRAERAEVVQALAGVTALLTDDQGVVIGGQKSVGQGLVVVFLRSSVLSEFAMGDVWGGQDLSAQKEQLYRLAYDLVNAVAGDRP